MSAENPWTPRGARVLVIEDDATDFLLLQRACEAHDVRVELRHATSAEAGLAQLREQRHDVVMLDLMLPGMSGLTFLTTLKADPALAAIPVIVLSGAAGPDEVEASYREHAAAVLSKPNTLEGYLTLVRGFRDFWLRGVLTVPPKP